MSWRPNPYDQDTQEDFDEWVDGLQKKILLALHPPRQRLFPDPEPVYVPARPPRPPPAAPPPPAADDAALAGVEGDEEILYPVVPPLTSVDKGKVRDDGRGAADAEARAPEPIVLLDDDDDADGSIEGGSDEQMSSAEEVTEEEEEDLEPSQSDDEEESSGEEAEYDSDGDVIPRPVKSLLDLEAAEDDDDGEGDADEEADDMFEDDAVVLPPLDERDGSPSTVAVPAAPDQLQDGPAQAGFVSALSLPIRRPSPAAAPPAPATQQLAPPLPPAPAPSPPAQETEEVEVFELSDSDDDDDAAPARAAASSDGDESMEDDGDDADENVLLYSDADDEEDELEESESGEELDEDEEGQPELPSPTSYDAAVAAIASVQPAFLDGMLDAPPWPFEVNVQVDQGPVDYSTHPPALPDGGAYIPAYYDQPVSPPPSPPAASQPFEVDPSLLESAFPPAPLDMSSLPASTMADLVAISAGGVPFPPPPSDAPALALPEPDTVIFSPASPPAAVQDALAQPPPTSLPSPPAEPLVDLPTPQPAIELDAAPEPAVTNPSPNGFADGPSSPPIAPTLSDSADEVEVQGEVYHTGFTPEPLDADVEASAAAAAEDEDMLADDDGAVTPQPAAVSPVAPAPTTDAATPPPPSPPPSLPPVGGAVQDGDEAAQEDAPGPVEASQPVAVVAASSAPEEEDELEDSDASSDDIQIIEPPADAQSPSSSSSSSESEPSESERDESEMDDSAADDESDAADEPPAPARPTGSRKPLPLNRKSTDQVAATHAQVNPFAALSVEGMSSSEDESAGSTQGADSDNDDEDNRESTPVQQTLDIPDLFELEHERAVQPDHPAVVADASLTPERDSRSPTPPVIVVTAQPEPETTDAVALDVDEPVVAEPPVAEVAEVRITESEEPLLPASPPPDGAPVLPSPSAEQKSLPLPTTTAGFTSPDMPASPPIVPMEVEPAPESLAPASQSPAAADAFELEHEAAMQPAPAAVLDAQIEAAEEHTENLTLVAQHSLDEFEREHDAAMQPPPALVLEDIVYDEAAPSSSVTGSDDLMADDPVLPISTPLHEPGEVSLPGYVEPAAEPDLPDATVEPVPTTLLTPPVPHAAELEGSAVAEPADTRPTTPEADAASEPLPLHAPLPDPFLPPPTTDLAQPHIEPNLTLSASLKSEDGESQAASVPIPSEPAPIEEDSPSADAAAQATSAAVAEPLAPASSGYSVSTVVNEIKSGERGDGDETDGGSDEGSDGNDDSDDDGMVFIESRRLSGSSSAAKETPPSPPRELPERFLASDVFTEAPEELPAPPTADAATDEQPTSASCDNSRTLSYHQHGSSSSGGPSRVPRAVVAAPFAGTPSPRKRSTTASPFRSVSPAGVVHSPVTRSQCVYHVLEVPGPGTRRTRFAVPYCSLANVEAITKEGAAILGVASPDENERRAPLVGNDAVDLDEALDQALTRIVGIDMVKEGHCFLLERVPARQPSQASIDTTDTATAGSSSAAGDAADADAMQMDEAASPRKRKRSEEAVEESASAAAEQTDDVAPDAALPAAVEADDVSGASSDEPAQEPEDGEQASSAKRQRLSEEPSSAAATPPPASRWSFWPFSR